MIMMMAFEEKEKKNLLSRIIVLCSFVTYILKTIVQNEVNVYYVRNFF